MQITDEVIIEALHKGKNIRKHKWLGACEDISKCVYALEKNGALCLYDPDLDCITNLILVSWLEEDDWEVVE